MVNLAFVCIALGSNSASRDLGLDGLAMGISTSTTWRRGIVVSGVRRMNEVNPRRAWLVLGWVTVFGQVYYL